MGQSLHPNVQLLTKIEKSSYEAYNDTNYLPFDTFLAASFLFPSDMVQKTVRFNATMELHGRHTRGEVIINRMSKETNALFIEKISENDFKRIMLWAAELN